MVDGADAGAPAADARLDEDDDRARAGATRRGRPQAGSARAASSLPMRREAMRRAWDAVGEAYAEMRDPGGEDARLLDELAAELPTGARVLDVGCGDGRRTLANLGGLEAVGLDLSRRQLELAREAVPAVRGRLVHGEMTALPLRADSVDAVTAYHSVFHVPRDEHAAVYAEFARVLRPDGLLLSTVGSGAYETTRPDWLGTGRSMFWSAPGRRATRARLRDAGFELVWEREVDDPLGSSVPFVLARLAG